jgi:hypothetical protein
VIGIKDQASRIALPWLCSERGIVVGSDRHKKSFPSITFLFSSRFYYIFDYFDCLPVFLSNKRPPTK